MNNELCTRTNKLYLGFHQYLPFPIHRLPSQWNHHRLSPNVTGSDYHGLIQYFVEDSGFLARFEESRRQAI